MNSQFNNYICNDPFHDYWFRIHTTSNLDEGGINTQTYEPPPNNGMTAWQLAQYVNNKLAMRLILSATHSIHAHVLHSIFVFGIDVYIVEFPKSKCGSFFLFFSQSFFGCRPCELHGRQCPCPVGATTFGWWTLRELLSTALEVHRSADRRTSYTPVVFEFVYTLVRCIWHDWNCSFPPRV